MSIETQATFFYRNVCDYDPSINKGSSISESIAAGFAEFSALLRAIYQDWRSFETSALPKERTKIGINADDLENLNNMKNAVLCLSIIAGTGELRSEGETQYLHINKDVFKKYCKFTTPVKFILSMLEKHGFYFTYSKGEKEAADYVRCDSFNVYYENGAALLGALKYIKKRMSEPERKKEFSKEAADIHSRMPGGITFLVADYDVILNNKTTHNPLHETTLRTLGKLSDLWKELIVLLRDEYGLDLEAVEISCSPYVFPEKPCTINKRTRLYANSR